MRWRRTWRPDRRRCTTRLPAGSERIRRELREARAGAPARHRRPRRGPLPQEVPARGRRGERARAAHRRSRRDRRRAAGAVPRRQAPGAGGAGGGARLPRPRGRGPQRPRSAARPAGRPARRAVRRIRVFAAGDAGRLEEGRPDRGVGRAAAALAARAVAGVVRARGVAVGPRHRHPARLLRAHAAHVAARGGTGSRVRNLVRRPAVSFDLRVARERDVAVRLHAESLPRAVGGRAAGAPIEPQAARVGAPARVRARRRRRGGGGGRDGRRRESTAGAVGPARARQHSPLQRAVRLQLSRAFRGSGRRHGVAHLAGHAAAGGPGACAAQPRTRRRATRAW